MTDRIQKIQKLFNELNLLRGQHNCYNEFNSIISQILDEIDSLIKEEMSENDKNRYLNIYSRVSHTFQKEVDDIKYYQSQMRKKNFTNAK